MTVDEVYLIIEYIINKRQNGYLTPDEFNETINIAQKSYTAYLLGNFQRYTPGHPAANVEFGENETIRQRLTPIIYGYNLFVDVQGFSPYPGDYLQTDAMWWAIYGYTTRVRFAQQHQLHSYLSSVIDPVDSNPVYTIEYNGFRFFPNSLGAARLNYIRNPPDMNWGFTNSIYGLPIYNPLNSTDPVWDDLSIMEIIARCLRMVGVNLDAREVSVFANEIKNTGQ